MAKHLLRDIQTLDVTFDVTYDDVLWIVLNYLQKHKTVQMKDLNAVYIKNICKDFLREHGYSAIVLLDKKLLLQKQDLITHIRGM